MINGHFVGKLDDQIWWKIWRWPFYGISICPFWYGSFTSKLPSRIVYPMILEIIANLLFQDRVGIACVPWKWLENQALIKCSFERQTWLVGCLEHVFPYFGNNHPSWDFHIFQRGRYTTNQMRMFMICFDNHYTWSKADHEANGKIGTGTPWRIKVPHEYQTYSNNNWDDKKSNRQ